MESHVLVVLGRESGGGCTWGGLGGGNAEGSVMW